MAGLGSSALLLDPSDEDALSYESRQQLEIARKYLTDSNGAALSLSSAQRQGLASALMNRSSVSTANLTNRELLIGGFNSIDTSIRASHALLSDQIGQSIQAVEGTVVAAHAETINALNQLQSDIRVVHENIRIIGENLGAVSSEVVRLSNSFEEYMLRDRRANSIQRAETKLVQLDQKLERNYGHNNELRRTAIGILQAADLSSIRTNTILTRAEELCLSAPNYWLGPALVTLAQWVDGSQSVGNLNASEQVVYNTLKEAFVRDREKTSLFFGLVCLRANLIPEANRWFRLYVDMQRPESVDRTCVMLLNIYAGGLMGHGPEETEILDVMQGWLETLLAEGEHRESLVRDWTNTIVNITSRSARNSQYRALSAFGDDWNELSTGLQASQLHALLGKMLETELNKKDFIEDNTVLIDNMIGTLVTSFDGDELPIRREQEYQKLIVDLEGNEDLASTLRVIKDDVLSESKNFLGIISDAARESELSSASIATRQYAIRLQMPQIVEAWKRFTATYQHITPKVAHFTVGDFTFESADGTNEDQVVRDFVNHANKQERAELEATKTGTKQMVALVGGIALLIVGIVLLFIAGNAMGGLLAIAGVILAIYGYRAFRDAKKKQEEIQASMKAKRENGVLVIRMIMAELRAYRTEFAKHESFIPKIKEFFFNNAAEGMREFMNLDESYTSGGYADYASDYFGGQRSSSEVLEVFEDENGREYVIQNGVREYISENGYEVVQG